jgi:hypothetical protein
VPSVIGKALPTSKGQTCYPPLNTHLDQTPGNTERQVKIGFVTKVSPEPFQLSFERSPIWLLALEPSMCSGEYFKDVASPHALLELLARCGYNSTLFNRPVTRLGIGRVHFGEATASGTITKLVSGSYPFLQQAAANHRKG